MWLRSQSVLAIEADFVKPFSTSLIKPTPAGTTINAAVTAAAIKAVCDNPAPNGANGRRVRR
jgi:hypothetical protein